MDRYAAYNDCIGYRRSQCCWSATGCSVEQRAILPGLPAEELEQLRSLTSGNGFTLLAPYEGIPAPIVATAWGVQLQVGQSSDPQLTSFVADYSQGPQTPELGAPVAR